MKRTKMPKLRNGSKEDSNPGSLDCESAMQWDTVDKTGEERLV